MKCLNIEFIDVCSYEKKQTIPYKRIQTLFDMFHITVFVTERNHFSNIVSRMIGL